MCKEEEKKEKKKPAKKKGKNDDDSDEEVDLIPEQAYCGHWFHKPCFVTYVNKPPFNCKCPVEGCDEWLASIDIPADPSTVKNREKKFSMQQQHDAEQDDLDRLFGFN